LNRNALRRSVEAGRAGATPKEKPHFIEWG
jgi:hypothetical protein